MSDIKLISIPMDRFKQLESVYDAAMALAPVLAFMGVHSDVRGRERELIASFLNACMDASRRAKEGR